MTARTVNLSIEGMTCASCVARVEKRLQRLDGVEARVNLATEKARVNYPESVSTEQLVAAVAQAGYTATLIPEWAGAEIAAPEHRAGHDAARVTDGLSTPVGRGVDPASEPSSADDHAGPPSGAHDHSDPAGSTPLRTRLVVSAVLAIPVVVLAMVPAWQFDNWQWLSLVLAAPVVIWGGYPFHRATAVTLRHGALTMDTLITLGTGAAFLWSLWALFFGTAGMTGMTHSIDLFAPTSDPSSVIYLEVAAGVTVLLLLGRFIEQRSKKRAGEALHSLLELAAKDVTVLREHDRGTHEVLIPIDELRVGDLFVVRPGEKVASDGVIVDGSAAIDSSMLTGESVPAEVGPGDQVTGATIALGGRLVVRTTSVGDDTRLAGIARLVEDAQMGTSKAQRLADRISAVFVPAVIVLAVVTAVVWIVLGNPASAAFTAAVAVLIIACPCALGLATPVALLVGTGKGASLGILITGPESLERVHGIDTVVLDKTGTITTGTMSFMGITAAGDADEALVRAASLEAASEHPIAAAIVRGAAGHSLVPVSGFLPTVGLGVIGTIGGESTLVGRPAFAAAHGFALPPELERAIDAGQSAGRTVVVVAWNGQVRGVIEVADAPKPGAAEAVAALRRLGLDVLLLTGDNETTARAVAAEVGIERVIAGVMPEQKVEVISGFQRDGHRVAMVGDGVNDAAALATATLGIAMGSGTDIAMAAADITLVRDDLAGVPAAIELSRRTLATIRGNLFWAFAYNVAAIPLAALGMLNPMIAGAAMAFSSVFVVLNSLRLRAFAPRV